MRCRSPGLVGLWALFVKSSNIATHSSNFSTQNQAALNEIAKNTQDCLSNPRGKDAYTLPTAPRDLMIMDFEVTGTASFTKAPPVKQTKPYSTCMYLADTQTLAPNQFTTDTSNPAQRGSTAMDTMNLVLPSLPFDPAPINFGHAVGMNNVSYSEHLPLFTVGSNIVHEWTVFIRFHPYHHHTWPFQVLVPYPDFVGTPVTASTGWWVQKGDWRDVMGLYGSLVVRVNYVAGGPQAQTFLNGKLVMHCHFVFHEDFGMMAWFQMNTTAPPPLTFTPKDPTFTLDPMNPKVIGGTSQTCQLDNNPRQVYVTGRVNVTSEVLGNWFALEFGQVGSAGDPQSPQNCYGVVFRGKSRVNVQSFYVIYSIQTITSTCRMELGIALRLQGYRDTNQQLQFQVVPVAVNPPNTVGNATVLEVLSLICNPATVTNLAGGVQYEYEVLCYFSTRGSSSIAVGLRQVMNSIFSVNTVNSTALTKFLWTYGEGMGSSDFAGYANQNVQSCPLVLTLISFNSSVVGSTLPNLPNVNVQPIAIETTCKYGYFNLIGFPMGSTYVSQIQSQPKITLRPSTSPTTGAPSATPTAKPTPVSGAYARGLGIAAALVGLVLVLVDEMGL